MEAVVKAVLNRFKYRYVAFWGDSNVSKYRL